MAVKITVQWDGLQEALERLDSMEERAPESLQSRLHAFGEDVEQVWRDNTPRRTGKLQGGDSVEPDGLSLTLNNDVYYFDFVDKGHWTPRGWHTRHGYRPAKRRSHVEGREITTKTTEFIEGHLADALSTFLDDL